MVEVVARFPWRLSGIGEDVAGIGKVEFCNRCNEARHPARLGKGNMEIPVCRFGFKQVLGRITAYQDLAQALDVWGVYGAGDTADRQNLQRTAHCRDFSLACGVNRRHPDTPSRQGFDQFQRFQLAESLAYRSLTDAKFKGQTVLAKPFAGSDPANQDSFSQRIGHTVYQPVFVELCICFPHYR